MSRRDKGKVQDLKKITTKEHEEEYTSSWKDVYKSVRDANAPKFDQFIDIDIPRKRKATQWEDETRNLSPQRLWAGKQNSRDNSDDERNDRPTKKAVRHYPSSYGTPFNSGSEYGKPSYNRRRNHSDKENQSYHHNILDMNLGYQKKRYSKDLDNGEDIIVLPSKDMSYMFKKEYRKNNRGMEGSSDPQKTPLTRKSLISQTKEHEKWSDFLKKASSR